MKEETQNVQPGEQSLVKLYMELTGATESNARSVLMYVDEKSEDAKDENQDQIKPAPGS